jgi:hypothetical protein
MRRTLLKGLAAAIPSWAFRPSLSWGDDKIFLEWPDDKAVRSGLLRISLHPRNEQKVPSSVKVMVKIQEKWVELPRGTSEGIFEKEVNTGYSYAVRVTANDYITIERNVSVNRALAVVRVYLIPKGWPYYLTAGIEIPFEPQPRIAGVALGRRIPTAAELAKLIAEAEKAGFARLTMHPRTKQPLDDVHGSVMYFEPKDPNVAFFSFDTRANRAHGRVSPDLVMKLRSLFAGYESRVGSPAQLQPGKVRIVDNQYLIRFPRRITQSEVERYAIGLGAIVLRESDPKAGYWLIEFSDPQNLGRHLDLIAQQVKSGSLASGEPNLLFQLQSSGGFPTAADFSVPGFLRLMW